MATYLQQGHNERLFSYLMYKPHASAKKEHPTGSWWALILMRYLELNLLSRTYILAHTPFEFEERLKETEVKVKQSNKVESEVFSKIDLMVEGGWKKKATAEVTSEETSKYLGRGCSSTIANEEGRISGIWWNAKKSSDPNAKEDAGIDANYRFVVLLTRKSKSPFRMRLKLNVDVAHMGGLEYRPKGGSSKVAVEEESLDLTTDPATHYEGDCEGISRMNLSRMRKKGRLAKLSSVA